MDIKVGIQYVSREVVVDTADSAKDVEKAFVSGHDDGSLRLTDNHGRKVLIPPSKIAYIDLGEENARRVGFGLCIGLIARALALELLLPPALGRRKASRPRSVVQTAPRPTCRRSQSCDQTIARSACPPRFPSCDAAKTGPPSPLIYG